MTVLNTSASKAISGWSVHVALPSGTTLGTVWNANLDSAGPPTTLRNASYNGTLAPAAATTFGMTLNGTGSGLAQPACAVT
ncbi:cellulose binding domain-containing protein [Streptomyces sp. V4-01]|uniref:Cellulose binding domain-containing protein n=1 Tax=Actinacidiphila polyblastidii TaxID=3110430 RepID=A0ABU7PAV0_9ACTN|nr:cellulose binding domain-containing protein [Streptomyces sp. V4-01]